MSDADRGQDLTLEQLRQLSPPTLEVLRRQTIAFLYAIGRAQGVEYKVVKMEVRDGESNGLAHDGRDTQGL